MLVHSSYDYSSPTQAGNMFVSLFAEENMSGLHIVIHTPHLCSYISSKVRFDCLPDLGSDLVKLPESFNLEFFLW